MSPAVLDADTTFTPPQGPESKPDAAAGLQPPLMAIILPGPYTRRSE